MPFGHDNKYFLHPWEDLPLTVGEEDPRWNSLMARYGHLGCPGWHYEDVCAAPWDCASKGRCRIAYENCRKELNKPAPYTKGCLARDIPGAICQSPKCDC